jgi:hypothetical protein
MKETTAASIKKMMRVRCQKARQQMRRLTGNAPVIRSLQLIQRRV